MSVTVPYLVYPLRPSSHTVLSSSPAASPPVANISTYSDLGSNLPSRGPVHMDNQDGPWSVSVAETLYDARSFFT